MKLDLLYMSGVGVQILESSDSPSGEESEHLRI
jgi:hypothetical protein